MNSKNWIKNPKYSPAAVFAFCKNELISSPIISAKWSITSVGIYKAYINGKSITDTLLNPGYTVYDQRTQYQVFDVTDLLGIGEQNLRIEVADGWAVGTVSFAPNRNAYALNTAVNAELEITFANGDIKTIVTDTSWEVFTTKTEFAEFYYGETINLLHTPKLLGNALFDDFAATFPIIEHEGEFVREQESLSPLSLIITPKGERVIDFGQNMAGYVEVKAKGKAGERIVISHAEVLDSDGNFYTENYRQATNRMTYILDGSDNCFKPSFSFQGFRYIRLDEYPFDEVDLEQFRAIVIHSDMRRIGYFSCGNDKINQLYHNALWGQKSNYIDIPTDCPQRDERLGWTGDAQVFCRTAALNFDVKKFFKKWLGDMRADQRDDGGVWGTIPARFSTDDFSKKVYITEPCAAWGDAATIIPWELYRAYGDTKILEENFEMMKRWVEFERSDGDEEFLWLGRIHTGDWLAVDAGEDEYIGATSTDLIATAFFYHSIDLLIRTGEVLGEDMSEYKNLKDNVYAAFRSYFMENGLPKKDKALTEKVSSGGDESKLSRDAGMTQTAIVLILHFGLYEEKEFKGLADKLIELINLFDGRMSTGFVGTPYLLHVLTKIGRTDIAYKLLFEERNPSWLYSVTHGATTMWEHWNSIKEDGSFWSTDMNSFNHYAYGSVCDWLYGVAAGITVCEDGAGYRSFTWEPHPDRRLGHINCSLNTPCGEIIANWYYSGDVIHYEITVPSSSTAKVTLPNGKLKILNGGSYRFATAAD